VTEKETRSAYKDLSVWQRGMEFASGMIGSDQIAKMLHGLIAA
jgi:hypothetical protein